ISSKPFRWKATVAGVDAKGVVGIEPYYHPTSMKSELDYLEWYGSKLKEWTFDFNQFYLSDSKNGPLAYRTDIEYAKTLRRGSTVIITGTIVK
ncbi:hypothetical protein OFL77_26925, partial [Escherichia coli]|uniref:hypothetical protein n=1 Tax=Escherichia coli TaxID=562 RepID=UPI0021E0C468